MYMFSDVLVRACPRTMRIQVPSLGLQIMMAYWVCVFTPYACFTTGRFCRHRGPGYASTHKRKGCTKSSTPVKVHKTILNPHS